tara:strand:+ start:469 stop:2250 length:1782 start_codon:yes stop_codon:yes gene_type:complete
MAGDAVRQIKERLSVVDVIAPYVELHPAGKNMKGKSPFTTEKTPSFYVSPDRGMYYCFSTSQGGDIFTFVQEMEGVDFKGALKILAEKAGVELVREDPQKRTERERQYDVLEHATKFFEEYRHKKPEAQQYLEDRGVTPQTIAKWRIGYAPGPPDHGWRELKNALEAEKFTTQELLKAGLAKGADAGKEAYDLFRDRIMFPIFDNAGHVVAYSGRILTKDSEAPKYVNSPETELFNKSEILYGYDKAKQGIRTMDFCLCVEGQFDVVMAHQAGYGNTIAISGTALTAHHVMLLQRLSNRAVLALDADRAGIAAVKKAAELMLSRGMDVKVVRMPDGEDPADIIQKDAAEFKKMVGHATHVIEYLLDVLQDQNKDERAFKLKAREEILPYVARIPNRIDQEHFEGLIAQRLGTTKDAIHAETQRFIEKIQEEEQRAARTAVSQEQAPVKPEPNTKESMQRKEALLKRFAVLIDELPKEHVPPLAEHLQKVTGKSAQDMRELYSAEEIGNLPFRLAEDIERLPIKQVLSDIAAELNELAGLLGKEKRAEYDQKLRTGDDKAQMEAIVAIDKLQKEQKELEVDLMLFGYEEGRKLD